MPRLVCALLVLFGVFGCGGSPDRAGSLPALPSVTTGPSGGAGASSAPATPSSSVPPVVKPPLADQPTREGAAAFALYWADVLNNALVTLDASSLDAISEPGCEICQNYIASIRRAAAESKHFKGGEMTFKDAATAPEVGLDADVVLTYDEKEGRVYDRNGSLIKTVAEGAGSVSIHVVRVLSTWHADQMTFTR